MIAVANYGESIRSRTGAFCELGLGKNVPMFTLFGKLRKRIGTDTLSKLFSIMRDQLKAKGYMSEVFTFVDAFSLIAKASQWDERDKLIAQKIEKLNNETLPKVAVDPEAKIGYKGKDKYWYGFKRFKAL